MRDGAILWRIQLEDNHLLMLLVPVYHQDGGDGRRRRATRSDVRAAACPDETFEVGIQDRIIVLDVLI